MRFSVLTYGDLLLKLLLNMGAMQHHYLASVSDTELSFGRSVDPVLLLNYLVHDYLVLT